MTIKAYVDGQILTAGSLNNSWDSLMSFQQFIFNSSGASFTGSGNFNFDTYITSGTFIPTNRVLTIGTVKTNGPTVQVVGSVVFSVGPSGTSFTPTTSEMVNFNSNEQITTGFSFIGSTTWDNASVPALIRVNCVLTTGTATIFRMPLFRV